MAHMSQEIPEPLAHDHLDDLESFFYVFARIIHAYDRHGLFRSLAGDLPIWEKYSDWAITESNAGSGHHPLKNTTIPSECKGGQ